MMECAADSTLDTRMIIRDKALHAYDLSSNSNAYREATSFTDASFVHKGLHRELHMPKAFCAALGMPDASLSCVRRAASVGGVEWVPVDASLLVCLARAQFHNATRVLCARRPDVADRRWCFYIGGTASTLVAFVGYVMRDEHDVPAGEDHKMRFTVRSSALVAAEGSAPDTCCAAHYFAAAMVRVDVAEVVEVALAVGGNGRVQCGMTVRQAFVRMDRAAESLDGDGAILARLSSSLATIVQRACTFRDLRIAHGASIRAMRGNATLPAAPAPACHFCGVAMERVFRCADCFQALYCTQCGSQGALDGRHEGLCRLGFWNAEVEMQRGCGVCGAQGSSAAVRHCAECNSFACAGACFDAHASCAAKST